MSTLGNEQNKLILFTIILPRFKCDIMLYER